MEKNNLVLKRLLTFSDDDLVLAYTQVCANNNVGLLPNNNVFIEIVRAIQLQDASASEIFRPLEDVIKDAKTALLLEIGQRFCEKITCKREKAHTNIGVRIWHQNSDNQLEVCRLLSFCVGFGDGRIDEYSGEALGKCFFTNEEQTHVTI